MADINVMWQMTWPQKVTYTPSGPLAMFDQLDAMGFVSDYLTVMARETEKIRVRMLSTFRNSRRMGSTMAGK